MRIYECIDRSGSRYGMLLIIAASPTEKNTEKKWLCRCDCGTEKIIRASNLTGGDTTSCGCDKKNKLKKASTVHGYSKDMVVRPEYCAWISMKRRCNNVKHKQYKNYGGRGITVCDQWANNFEKFLADVGKRPTMRHSLDRWPDNNGNYEPGNVRWATPAEQNRNKRDNNVIEYRGQSMVLLDWASYFNIDRSFIYRLLEKHSVDEAFEKIKSGNYRERKIYATSKRAKAL